MSTTERPIPAQLVIDSERRGSTRFLTLHGELDLASAALLDRGLLDAELAGETRIVVDLGGLEFMDSTGLHVLLAADGRSRQNGHRLTLRRGPHAVHRVFELTGTAKSFEFD